jgi:hypothetical protein
VARLNDAVAQAESSLHGRVRLLEASLSRAVCDTEEAEAAHHIEIAAAWENIEAQHGQQRKQLTCELALLLQRAQSRPYARRSKHSTSRNPRQSLACAPLCQCLQRCGG